MSSVDSEPPEQDDVAPNDGQPLGRVPFEGAPRSLLSSRRGCSRMALAGCGLLALVLGLGVLTMILKATELVAWSLARIRIEVERTLPEDLPDVDRERLQEAFDAALSRVESGEMDPIAFQSLQVELMQFARRSRPPTVEEVRSLAEALETFAGNAVDEPATESEPAGRVALLVG